MEYITEPQFINRYKILKFFNNNINSNENKATSFIYSTSGVGKSRLCKEILKDLYDIDSKIKVSINISKMNSIQDGFYIKQIAKEIDKNYKDLKSISFEDFLKNDVEQNDIDNLIIKISNDYISKSPVLKNTKEIIEKFFTFGKFDSDKIFNSNISESVKICNKYIEACCKNSYFIINIENIQNIDYLSLEILSNVLSSVEKIYLLLEYTISNYEQSQTIDEIKNVLNRNNDIDFNLKELEYLSENDLIKILENNNELLKQYISSSYQQWNGNLRPLVDLHYTLAKNNEDIERFVTNSKNKLNDLIFNDIMNLTDKELFLLIMIALHADPVELNVINQVHNIEEYTEISTIFDYEIELDSLTKKRFLNKYNKSYIVNDDTILHYIINYDVFLTKRTLALKLWIKIYNIIYNYENNYFIPKSQILFNILNFSVKLEEEQNILKYLNELLFLFKNSTPIWVENWIKKILLVIDNSQNKIIQNLIKVRLSEITQNLSLYSTAYDIINSINSNQNNILLAKSILYENISKPKNGLDILNIIYEKNEKNPKLFLNCKINEISCLRSMNEYRKATKIYEKIINKDEYKKYFEYGYLLRQAGALYNATKAIPYSKKSIEHFQTFNAQVQELHSRIELSVMYIYNNDFSKAKIELIEAKKLSKNKFVETYIIDNNLAIVSLYQNDNIKKSFLILKKSLSMVQTPFDKLAIYINLLICMCCLVLEKESIMNLCETIDILCQQDKPSDKEIRRISYFNLMLASKIYNNDERFNEYKMKFLQVKMSEKKYEIDNDFNLLIHDKIEKSKSDKICNNVFITCELSHWTVELDNILNNFQ